MTRRIIALPLATFIFVLFAALLLMIPLLFFAGAVTFAFKRLGIPAPLAYALLWASLLGSVVNIPVGEVRSEREVLTVGYVRFFGIPYPVPRIERVEQKTVVAVNLGGCVIPVAVSLYVILRMLALGQCGLIARAMAATVIASVVFHAVARPVPGVGIAVPLFVPPLVSALLALTMAPENPAPVAYVCGSLGTLLGADVANLGKIGRLGAPIVSIGGAGTFDGIFLTGVLAVLLTW